MSNQVVSKEKIGKVINELDKMLEQEQREVEIAITSSAPQSFRDDMNGCARGISISRSKAIRFLKESLLK